MEINRLEELAAIVADKVPTLIRDAIDNIHEAITVAVEAAQADEGNKEAVLTLPFSVKWSIDTNKVEVALSVAVRHKYTAGAKMPDPSQPELLDRDGDPLPPGIAKSVLMIDRALKSKQSKQRGGDE